MDLTKALLENDPFPDILGQEHAKQQLKSALLVNRHVLILGAPGIGKTTLAKNVASLLNKNFIRIQGSPDLTAEDLLGDIDPIKAMQYGPLDKRSFTPGKIFKADKGILFFDEVNRCPEKLQNALLQVLEEGKATLGSYTVDIPASFIFIGTMNPEDSSTEQLSDVFLDRCDVVYMGYPETVDIEKSIVVKKGEKKNVLFPEHVLTAAISFIHWLRKSEKLERKPSVRASLGLYERSQSNALLQQKKKVEMEHLRDAILSVLAHRIRLKPSVKYLQTPAEFIEDELKRFLHSHGKDAGDAP
ncbi:MoxR family ATPase [Candidatus Woesearchaeota archaeon]|nr:MoxR family ATPase [Candidatus Woesearchaeota archaeon]